jgi:hypothetical protein
MRKKLFRSRKPSTKLVLGIAVLAEPTRALLLIVCLAFLATGPLGISPMATAQDPSGDVSLKTPEEAVTFYMQAVAQGDITQLMQACAFNEMSAGFRFDLYNDRLNYLTATTPAPSDYPFYAEMNRAQFSWQILNQVKNFVYGLLATEKGPTEGLTVRIDAEGTRQFMEEVNPARLAQLEVVEIGVPDPEMASMERNLEIWNRIAEIYGADEFTERVVLFLFEGDYYYVGFGLLRYGETWKISSASSILGNTSYNGVAEETTEEAFQDLIGGD